MKAALIAATVLTLVCSLHKASSLGKLNVPVVLLPYVPSSTGVKVNFTLSSPQGCFSWLSIKPDIVSVKPLYLEEEPGCSREAELTAQSTQPIRLSSIIIAEEIATGQTLRCDVFVASIESIEITTRTRELLLGEEPERFSVQAFDEEGNIFSTLGGHIFEWTLLPDEEATHQQASPEAILNFIPFEESSYSTDPVIRSLEREGLQGDMVLVAGVNTGTAKVRVRLRDRAWQGVEPDIVKLLVIENIMLQPSMDVYILPLSFVEYRVERRKHGRSEVITMPSEQYSLELTNTTVGRLHPQRSRVTGLVVGYTEAILQDINMLHTPSASKPSAGIHVVPPHHLGFSIAPGNNWMLEVGRDYAITVNVFNKMNHKIIITENVPLSTELPSLYLESHFSSLNSSYHYVRALKKGVATLHSTLSKLTNLDTGEVYDLPTLITKHQVVEINDPVQVTPKHLVILWDPQTEFKYQHQLNVTGGSGSYQWSCDVVGIVGVSSTGLLTTKTKGNTLVVAVDTKNTAHFDKTEVFVVPPAVMTFLPSRVEALVGTTLTLPLQIKGHAGPATPSNTDNLQPFQDCSKLTLNVQSSDQSVFNVTSHDGSSLQLRYDGACTSLKATATTPGHTTITVTYNHRGVFLQAVVTIAAYPPLRLVDPEIIAVVTLGSSKNFVFKGGPAPWVQDQSKFVEKLVSNETSSIVSSHHMTRGGALMHVYRVVCRGLGAEFLTLSVGNERTHSNRFPANQTTTARIYCAEPVSMTIRPVIGHMPDCPLLTQTNNHNIQFPVRSGRPLTLEITLYDNVGRVFDNFTSLQWTWESSNQNALPTPQTSSLQHKDSETLLSVILGGVSGAAVLTASSNQYLPSVLSRENLSPQGPFSPGVNFSLSLLLRNPPELTPNEILLFNHPLNKGALTITHGSDHFRVDHMTKTLPPASTLYTADTRQITLTPVLEGLMTISLTDLCLEIDKAASSAVIVAGVYSIEVHVTDKLQLGNSSLAFVRVLDSRQVPFPVDQLRLMNLRANPKSSHIKVAPAPNQILSTLSHDQTSHSAVYQVTGVAVGTAHLLFNATSNSRVLSSWPKEVQVFDALQLFPEHITLLPTATFQIHSSGGPVPHSTVVYTISNITVATVDETGLIVAATPGVTIVTGQAQTLDSNTGQLVTYSQDEVHVHVIKLTGIKLFVPSTKLLAGEEIAVYAIGMHNESPFSFGSVTSELSFHWSVSNMDILVLSSVYEEASVSLDEEQDFDAMLRARNPGQSVVRITAKCGTGMCDPELATFTNQVQVRVLPPLELLRPMGGHFLLPQNGKAKIVTNRDGISRLSYQLMQSVGVGSGSSVIRVSSEGEIGTAAVNGHAVVMVTADAMGMGINQSVVVHVEVRQISSVSIVPLSFAQATPSSKDHAYPLGYSAEFIVYLHDNIGRQFKYASIPLSHRLSRSDIVRMSPESGNSTYTIKASKQGNTILKIWTTSHPHIIDYVRIQVGYAILPSLATVHLGCTICFTTHLKEETTGLWSVGEKGVLQIKSKTGVGVAKSTGRAVVYHSSYSTVDTHTEITVSKVEHVQFSASLTPTFTNAQRKPELGSYRIPVQFYHSNNELFSPLYTSPACSNDSNTSGSTYLQQVPFQCKLELKEANNNPLFALKYITVDSIFDATNGQSYCELGPADAVFRETIATTDRLSLSLQVRVFDLLKSYEVLSMSSKVPFVPAFVLSRDKIRLGSGETFADVKVTGLPQQLQELKVVSPYPVSAVRISSPTPTEANYRISLLDNNPFSDDQSDSVRVTFTTTLAQQETSILVTLMSHDELSGPPLQIVTAAMPSNSNRVSTESPFSDDFKYVMVIVITILAVVIATFVICMAVKQGSSQSSMGFAAHLPPKGPPQAAFTPGTPHTPFSPRTPGHGGSAGGSAFKRPGYSPSPQHGLFSQ